MSCWLTTSIKLCGLSCLIASIHCFKCKLIIYPQEAKNMKPK